MQKSFDIKLTFFLFSFFHIKTMLCFNIYVCVLNIYVCFKIVVIYTIVMHCIPIICNDIVVC